MYNLRYCTKSITPLDVKPPKKLVEYEYADFQCDIIGSKFVSYMLCYVKYDDDDISTFTGSDYNNKFLDYLLDNYVTYLHIFSYDIKMISKYGICRWYQKR